MGKGEIARYEQFLLFPQYFQKACFPGASEGVIVWEWVNSLPNDNILDWSKFKAFADEKIHVAKKMEISFEKGRIKESPGDVEECCSDIAETMLKIVISTKNK